MKSNTPLDPTKTYTILPKDWIAPFEGIAAFKEWHDAALAALVAKDEKIKALEETIRKQDEDTRESWIRLPYALHDLEEARKELESARTQMDHAHNQLEAMSKRATELHSELQRLKELAEGSLFYATTGRNNPDTK
jgi:septal ring factor EnvC (AmiA/AmiB activator)